MNATTAVPVPYASRLDLAARGPLLTFRTSKLGHQEAFDELAEVWEECRHPGWDGYDSKPVEQDTLRYAYLLTESLPLGFPRPSIGAEPDGQLTMEWRKSTSRVLSISIDPDGLLHYAGLFGAAKKYGTLPLYCGEAPKELLHLVEEL